VSAVHAFGVEFDVGPGYLDTPSVGVPPRPAAAVVRDHVDAWSRGLVRAPQFDEPVARARSGFATLVGVEPSAVTIGSAVSQLVGLVASSLPRARVLVAEREFTSVSFPFAAAGHVVTEVPLADIAERAGEHDVVAVSVVASADGAVVDLDGLRRARDRGALVVLDATQALGWFDADLSWADVVVAASYKWLLAPRGAAWMATTPSVRARLTPAVAGWYAGEVPARTVYGLPLRLAADARRLDLSPSWVAHVGAAVSLPWLASLDRAAVHRHAVGLADRVRAALGPEVAGAHRSAIVAVHVDGATERLARAGVTASSRDGATRLGFGLHNTDADVDRVLDALG
jgi:selenocysteine lyase/cysteine desulfurase